MNATIERSSSATADREIATTRVFDAPRDLVFDAWTDPEHVAQWWGPNGFTTTTHSMDVRPGGEWIFIMHGPDGTDYKNHIVYREVVRPERLVYDHVSGPLFRATVIFEAEGDKTRIRMQMLFETAELRNQGGRGVRSGGRTGADAQSSRRARGEAGAAAENLSSRASSMRRAISSSKRGRSRSAWRSGGDRRDSRSKSPKSIFVPAGCSTTECAAPDGSEMWGKFVYREITPPERMVFIVSFSDENGGTTRHPMAPTWPLEMLNT